MTHQSDRGTGEPLLQSKQETSGSETAGLAGQPGLAAVFADNGKDRQFRRRIPLDSDHGGSLHSKFVERLVQSFRQDFILLTAFGASCREPVNPDHDIFRDGMSAGKLLDERFRRLGGKLGAVIDPNR